MELELALHPDDAAKVPHIKPVEAAKAGRIRTQTLRLIWHDSPDHALAADRLSLVETRGIWQLERLRPAPEDVWPPGTPPPCLAEADQPSGLPHALPDPLAPLAAFDGKSTTLALLLDQEPVSLVLLRGVLRTVAAEHPVCRLRIAGADASVLAIALLLTGELRLSVPHASLAAEGLALATGAAPIPRRLGAPELSEGSRASVAGCFRHVLGHLTDVILHYAPAAASAQAASPEADTEPVHQMRVAVRRARSAISIFREALDCPAFETINQHLKTLGSRLGPARDWDVFVTETAPAVAAALPDDTKLGHLITAAQRRRREAHAVLHAWLSGPEFRRLGIELAWLAASDGWVAAAGGEQQAQQALPLAEFAAAILQRRWKKVLGAGKQIESLNVPSLHALRLRAKRARYAAEIFMTLYPGKATHRFVRRLSDLQGVLGVLNDGAVAGQLLRDLGATTSRHGYAVGLVLGFAAASAAAIRPMILRKWDKFTHQAPFWT